MELLHLIFWAFIILVGYIIVYDVAEKNKQNGYISIPWWELLLAGSFILLAIKLIFI